jgi:hypothetical protein
MNFLDKHMHFSKEWSAVFTKVFAHVEGPLESNVALSKSLLLQNCCTSFLKDMLHKLMVHFAEEISPSSQALVHHRWNLM